MFLSSSCLKLFSFKDRGMKSCSPIFFFMYYCPKEAKNTNALREVIMKNKQKRISDELRCSQFFFKSERAEAVSVKGILEITARY